MDSLVEKLMKLGELPSWWWNPNNLEARKPYPQEVRDAIDRVDPLLEITWNPIKKRWQLWGKPDMNNRVTAERVYAVWSKGWRLLGDFEDQNGDPLPLTSDAVTTVCAMVLAKNFGGAEGKLAQTEARAEKVRASRKQTLADQRKDWVRGQLAHWRPSVGYGKANGSKFSKFG